MADKLPWRFVFWTGLPCNSCNAQPRLLMAGDRRSKFGFCFCAHALWPVRGALQPEKVGQDECNHWICMNLDLRWLEYNCTQTYTNSKLIKMIQQFESYSFWFVGNIVHQGQPECCSQTQPRRPSTWSKCEVTWGYKDVQVMQNHCELSCSHWFSTIQYITVFHLRFGNFFDPSLIWNINSFPWDVTEVSRLLQRVIFNRLLAGDGWRTPIGDPQALLQTMFHEVLIILIMYVYIILILYELYNMGIWMLLRGDVQELPNIEHIICEFLDVAGAELILQVCW